MGEQRTPAGSDDRERRQEAADLWATTPAPLRVQPHGLGPWGEVHGSALLLSAPHAVAHVRDGAAKQAERDTGALVRRLAARHGTSAMVALPQQLGDPNWDAAHPYVDRILHWPKPVDLVVDFHIMRPRGVDLCVGLGSHPDRAEGVWQLLADEAVRADLRVSINWPFSGAGRPLTSRLQHHGVRAVQVELSWECFEEGSDLKVAALSALARWIERLCPEHRRGGVEQVHDGGRVHDEGRSRSAPMEGRA